jgi:murein DD-endopeptidase MepM/ murein hydrolase activator NlpD
LVENLTLLSRAAARFQRFRLDYFPERQLFLRSEGRVRFLTIHSYTQMTAATAIIVSLGWGAVTSYAYLSRDFVIEDKNNTISSMSAQYQTLSTDFSVLEEEFERRAQLLEERQQFIENFIEPETDAALQNTALDAEQSKNSAAPIEKKTEAKQKTEAPDQISLLDRLFSSEDEKKPAAKLSNIERRQQLLARLQTMETRQRAVATILNQRILDQLKVVDETLVATPLTTTRLVDDGQFELAAGGPFIPDRVFDGVFDAEDGLVFLTLKENSDRLKMVTNALDSYPVGKPAADYYLSSRFGRRRDPVDRTRWGNHPGLDLAAWPGTAIMATAPGTVIYSGWYGPYGNMIEIDHGNGFHTRYGHMRKLNVKKNEDVNLGQKIGEMGSTGRVTGTHVHYEVWFNGEVIDPMPIMKAAANVLEIQGRNEKNNE